jgi:tetratricopeptide (TPR) repeat protein
MALTAFVARSFDPKDEQRIRPILNFLETFRKAGFLCAHAEAAQVEEVHVKVRKMIDASNAFVGFFTKKYPVYRLESRWSDALSLARGKLQPEKWSAPPWVLQESGYAISAGKKVILLREEGVDIPGLQGDLEYVPFDSRDPSAVFSKLSEMINDLLAKDAGREIKTEITERSQQAEAKPEAPALTQGEKLGSAEQQPSDIIDRLIEMQEAAGKRNLSGVYESWKGGSTLIAGGKTNVDALSWDCVYFTERYRCGDPDGLEALRRIHNENPQRREPITAIARLLVSAKEHDEAARLFLEAASLAGNKYRAEDLTEAARALNELKRYEEGIKAAEECLRIAGGDQKWTAIPILYQLLKNSGEPHLAFATAEAALHDNPLLGLRFGLGLDYRLHGFKELALHHFKFLHERNADETGSLHNLALLSADCQLPIMSVGRYKRSFALGDSLSAANLGFMYLDAGMADEATALVKEAMLSEQHESNVEQCLAEIRQRTENEGTKQSDLLKTASDEKDFFVGMGTALQRVLADVDGPWEFPFGEMTLARKGSKLSGTATISKDEPPNFYDALLASPLAVTGKKEAKIENYTLDGTIKGAVCKFSVTVTEPGQHPFGSMWGGQGTRSGFIVFATDGKSATYAELTDNKLNIPAKIAKIEAG